jgi:hypothetical protein
MSKNIVICMDGTWNDPSEQTNVYQLFESLNAGPSEYMRATLTTGGYAFRNGPGVAAFYVEGVGAAGRKEHLLGGTTGAGLRERVLHAFMRASVCYEPGDKFWIFGFSRGAWAARSLSGMIAGVGLMHRHDALGDEADLIADRLWHENKRGGGERGKQFWSGVDQVPIRMVGVWDTVGALGIPFLNGIKMFDEAERRLLDFADRSLSERVEHGRQALAIDERRFDFTPTLWDSRENVLQVWFTGGHSDVGGGYPRRGLSDIALVWMAEQIKLVDPAFPLDMSKLDDPHVKPDFMQHRHDESQKAIWQARPVRSRDIPVDANLHESVVHRLSELRGYRPAALQRLSHVQTKFDPWTDGTNDDVWTDDGAQCAQLAVGKSQQDVLVHASRCWNSAQLQVAEGESYRVSATGEWWDADNRASAAGYDSPKLALAEGVRRVPKAKWFSLIAAVHQEPGLESKNPTAHNFFTGVFQSVTRSFGEADDQSDLTDIGTEGVIEVAKDGYLYLFANDATFTYSNNHGAVNVTIERLT